MLGLVKTSLSELPLPPPRPPSIENVTLSTLLPYFKSLSCLPIQHRAHPNSLPSNQDLCDVTPNNVLVSSHSPSFLPPGHLSGSWTHFQDSGIAPNFSHLQPFSSKTPPPCHLKSTLFKTPSLKVASTDSAN